MIVHTDEELVHAASAAVRRNGHAVSGFTDPIVALHAIEAAMEPPALVAGIRFGVGRLHGVALGLMAARKRPGTPVLLLASSDDAGHAKGVGRVIPADSPPQAIADALEGLLRSGSFG